MKQGKIVSHFYFAQYYTNRIIYDYRLKYRYMKKVLKTLFLSIILVLFVNNAVFAETIYTEGALNYVIRDGSIIIINYFGNESKVVVPDHIGGYIVTGIANNALTKECIEKVVLPETITSIEEGAIIEHTPVAVQDSYGNTITEDIENLAVDEDFFISSEEYDELQGLEYEDSEIFEDEDTTEVEEKKDEEFEEIYSSKVSSTVKKDDVPLAIIMVCATIAACVILFIKKKNSNK